MVLNVHLVDYYLYNRDTEFLELAMSNSNIIQEINNEQMTKDIPEFSPGDTIIVQVKVKEGTRERLQAFEGVVIAIKKRGINSAFTVRKI